MGNPNKSRGTHIRIGRESLLAYSAFVFSVFLTIFFIFGTHRASATDVSDNFDRTDGDLGSNWTTVAGTGNPQIISNQVGVGAVSSLRSAYWSANTFSSDQYSQAKFPSNPNGTNYGPAIAVRLADSKGYILWWGNSADTMSIWRMDSAGSWTQIASAAGLTIAGTDVWKLTAEGSTLKGYQNGTLILTTTDATYTDGSPGVWLYYAVNQLDDWSGGDLVGTYSVGGTISGVSGTVILQNNSGDNLSLASNGSFTFATSLSDAATYAVTVSTYPTGQTCTVSNGSGTVASANVTNVSVSCVTNSAASATDDFNRSNGVLGPSWTNFTGAGVTISSQQVIAATGNAGAIRTGESFGGDQYSEIEVTATQPSGTSWIAATARTQNGGQDLYLGLYWWNGGTPVLRVYKRISGGWTQLGATYSSGALAAGTKLRLVVAGTNIWFLQDGLIKIRTSDSVLSGGAPGIMFSDNSGAIDNWSGGNATALGFQANYVSTDVNGVKTYQVFSNYNDLTSSHTLRVLEPTSPAAGVAHNFIYALPVEPEGGTTYGDGLETLRALGAQNTYNLTVIAPSFPTDPWYADHPTDSNYKYESFMVSELQPWVTANLATSGSEQHWLLGFSKSGFGPIDLMLRDPDSFTLGAFWDFPALGFTAYDGYGASSATNYGTDANFQANYRLTDAFVEARKTPFLSDNRIWISGYQAFQTDVADFDTFLTGKGIQHTMAAQVLRLHRWDSDWVPDALAALYADSTVAPTVTNVSSGTPTSTSVNITWSTDKNSSSKVDYGVSSSYGSSTTETDTSTRVGNHSVGISSLLPCTKYFYRPRSKNSILNETIGSGSSFITSGCTASSTIADSTIGTITANSGGSVVLNSLTLTVPASFKTGVSSAIFQVNQLDGATFFATVSVPSGKSKVGSAVFNLQALTDPTTTITSFTNSLSVTMSYSSSDITGLNESTLTIYRYDGSTWSALTDCSTDTSARTVTCSTSGFSDFALFGTTQASSTSGGGGGGPVPSIMLPIPPEGGFKMTINNGIKTSTSRIITLGLVVGSNTTKMAISNNKEFDNAVMEKFAPEKQWDICSDFYPAMASSIKFSDCPLGLTTVYAKFYTAFDRASPPVSANIVFIPPDTTGAIPSQTNAAPVTSPIPITKISPLSRNLRMGMRGKDVRDLQLKLKQDGIFSGPITGYFGPLTRTAIRAFQCSRGIVCNGTEITTGWGQVGPKTRRALNGM